MKMSWMENLEKEANTEDLWQKVELSKMFKNVNGGKISIN